MPRDKRTLKRTRSAALNRQYVARWRAKHGELAAELGRIQAHASRLKKRAEVVRALIKASANDQPATKPSDIPEGQRNDVKQGMVMESQTRKRNASL